MMAIQLTPAEFFFCHAGFSYDPHKQSMLEGKMECARAMAMAERWASENGLSFEWKHDDERGDNGELQWCCIVADCDGEYLGSLYGIMFGEEQGPFDGDPYRRVIEAELAGEAMCDGSALAADPLAIRLDVCQQETSVL